MTIERSDERYGSGKTNHGNAYYPGSDKEAIVCDKGAPEIQRGELKTGRLVTTHELQAK